MDRVYERCCGIDVHKKIVVACFRCGRKQELREFGTTTKELLRLADWLIQNECQMIAIAIFHILKDNTPFVDLGSEYYNQFNKERKINVYLKKLKALGWESDTAAASLPA